MTTTKQHHARLLPTAAKMLIAAATSTLVACNNTEAATTPPTAPIAVRVASPTQATLRETVRYVGTARYAQEILVRAQLPGALVELPAREGAAVEKGQVVAHLFAPDADARVRRVRSEVRRATAEQAHACSVYETDGRLHRSGAIAGAELDRSRKACEVGRQGVAAVRAQLAEFRAIRGKAVEHAPLDGQVLAWRAEPGENVTPGQPLLVIGSGSLEIEVPVAELDVRRGVTADTVVEVRTLEAWRPSEILRIAPQARGAGRAVDVRVAVPEPEVSRLRSGMSVDVRFVLTRSAPATTVPQAALRADDQGSAVFLVRNQTVHRQAVRPGIAAEGRVTIDAPLPQDAMVAVSNLDQLTDGERVYAVPVADEER